MTVYKAGTKLNSAVCDTQIMILRVPGDDMEISCGGTPMQSDEVTDKGAVDGAFAGGTLPGKRYVDDAETMEFLCTRGGEGTISVNGIALDIKQAKRLPSSD